MEIVVAILLSTCVLWLIKRFVIVNVPKVSCTVLVPDGFWDNVTLVLLLKLSVVPLAITAFVAWERVIVVAVTPVIYVFAGIPVIVPINNPGASPDMELTAIVVTPDPVEPFVVVDGAETDADKTLIPALIPVPETYWPAVILGFDAAKTITLLVVKAVVLRASE